MNDHLLWKHQFIRFTTRFFCECLAIFVCASFCFKGGMWDSIVFFLDHCISSYLTEIISNIGILARKCLSPLKSALLDLLFKSISSLFSVRI